jgi:alkanesulfonate monooxygenase SsuD/methylene tetrahydromethanopterin reductase-like flavin-dependent oxidoreductase (luciferase family)
MLNIGVVFPGKEITDPGGVRDFVQAAEDLGYSHLLMHDHVLGVDVTHRPDLDLPKKPKNFHEAFVLLGFIAALTRRIELVTGVLVLTQRQTALVAKQAAELDCLSSGRLRLGVGIGYVDRSSNR